MKCWLSWKLSKIGNHAYMVRSLLCIQTVNHWRTSSHNPIFSVFGYNGLKILLIFFFAVVFITPIALPIHSWMQSLDTLTLLLFWLQTPLCPTSLTRFSSSKSMILSWEGTEIMHTISLMTTVCLQRTLVTFFTYKGKLYIPWSLTKTILWE